MLVTAGPACCAARSVPPSTRSFFFASSTALSSRLSFSFFGLFPFFGLPPPPPLPSSVPSAAASAGVSPAAAGAFASVLLYWRPVFFHSSMSTSVSTSHSGAFFIDSSHAAFPTALALPTMPPAAPLPANSRSASGTSAAPPGTESASSISARATMRIGVSSESSSALPSAVNPSLNLPEVKARNASVRFSNCVLR